MKVSALLAAALAPVFSALPVDTLRSTRALPVHIAGRFQDITACEPAPDGSLFVFDRRGHSVFNVPPSRDEVREVVQIGQEPGRILSPHAFDVADDGSFVVADAPGNRGRVQVFLGQGASVGGFVLPDREVPLFIIDRSLISGISSLEYTGKSVLMSRPELGSLIVEYGLDGRSLRAFGVLRGTGHENDRIVHLAMNAGFVLANPKGGFYYVFAAGLPAFRKYDASGTLVFERHIEGTELDDYARNRPTSWPRRKIEDGAEVPLIRPAVRAAAVDANGGLWVALTVPYTYVYDESGDKRRVVQFQAAGIVSPTAITISRSGRLLTAPGCFEFDVK